MLGVHRRALSSMTVGWLLACGSATPARAQAIPGPHAHAQDAAPAHAQDTAPSAAQPTAAAYPQGADDAAKATCREAYASAQLHRRRGELLASRGDLRTCGAEACPAFARVDCVQWLSEVEADIPTIVVEANADGNAVFEVAVKLDGEPVEARLDGRPIAVDPGLHGFTFDTAGRPTLEQRITVREGEKNRLLVANWVTPRSPTERPIPLGVYVTGAVALLGFADFAAAATLGNTVKTDLEVRQCAPFCSPADVAAMRTRYLVGDIGLAIGAVDLVASVVLFVTRPAVPSRARFDAPFDAARSGFFASGSVAGGIVGWRTAF